MSDGFMGFKALGWCAAALLGTAAILPSTSTLQWNPLRSAKDRSTSELQRPSLLKKSAFTTTTTTTTIGTAIPTTTTSPYPELTTIPSNFDIQTELVPVAIPASSAPDVGAFRFMCGPGQIAADDPIVFPGQPGKSHLHQFFGNTGANAYSTYQSLRTTGQSTCMSPLNRSGYWIPALLNGKGSVIRPDGVGIYYKRWPETSPHCNTGKTYPNGFDVEGVACLPLPNGLRFIFGFNMLNPGQAPTGAVQFMCAEQVVNWETMTQALNRCRSLGSGVHHFLARIAAPTCWDGKNLDSADHRSHIAYATYSDQPDGMNGWGYLRCPTDHPYVIPEFTMTVGYTIESTDDTTLWHYASDEMIAGGAPGSTFHADWFGAWDPVVQSMWTDNCINKNLNCSGGNLGNGFVMKMYSGFTTGEPVPRLVPIPS